MTNTEGDILNEKRLQELKKRFILICALHNCLSAKNVLPNDVD